MKRNYMFPNYSGLFVALFFVPWLGACATSSGGGEPQQVMSLEVTYVAGHLGSGNGCSTSGTKTSKGDSDSAQCIGEGCEGGPFSTSCDNGELTLQLRNLGEHTLSGLEVSDLELLEVDQTFIKVLDVEAVNFTDGEPFDGTLEPGAIVQLRVDFFIPEHDTSLQEGRLHVLVADETGQTSEITTPTIELLHVIDT
jgi:hypothetical protein